MLSTLTLAFSLGSLSIAEASCTKESCIFSEVQGSLSGIRCGQVDAAPRMPDDIWNDPAAVQRYVDFTNKFFFLHAKGATQMKQEPCSKETYKYGDKTIGPFTVQKGGATVPWASDALMQATCSAFCNCGYQCPTCKPNRALPACRDKADQPGAHKYCSLCGPKFNAPILISYYYPEAINSTNSTN